MVHDVIIRKAKPNDVPIILGLLNELGRPKPKKDSEVDAFRKLVKKYLKDSDKEILVAENNQIEIIGFVSIMFLPRLNQTNFELYIPELVVQKRVQNKGVGKKLMDSCISLGKAKNCHRIRLESGIQRKKSHEFYKSLGFKYSANSFSKILNKER